MTLPIKLIVGLGNPGSGYANTRHNVGAWLVQRLAEQMGVTFKAESKFMGNVGKVRFPDHDCWLLLPTTFMNLSGQSVRAIAQFYKIPVESILIAHDELDFPAGTVRFKQDGGHGGHNGLRDIIQQLGSKQFHRIRIGIDHPGNSDDVSDYVLCKPSRKDHHAIMQAIDDCLLLLPNYIKGDRQDAIKQLHT